MPVLLLMKVLVGGRTSSVYHVFELDLEMPKFAAYAAEDRPPPGGIPVSHVCFELQHPASRIASWLEARFGARTALAAAGGSSSSGGVRRSSSGAGKKQQQQLTAHFTCLRTKQQLAVMAAPGPGGALTVWLHCDSMTLAGEMLQVRDSTPHSSASSNSPVRHRTNQQVHTGDTVAQDQRHHRCGLAVCGCCLPCLSQDLAGWLGVTEVNSTASFPAAMAAFQETLKTVEAASAARSLVDGDAAQLAGAIKGAVVRAEDARLLGDVSGLKRAHKRLADLNRDMWLEHGRRVSRQQELLAGLKAVNQMIQAAAGLRVGPAQGKVVAACRAAIKANDLAALERVVSGGV